MANRLIAERQRSGELSPTDPQECCEWANLRMRPELKDLGYQWVTTGDPKKPIALAKPRHLSGPQN